jgi:hypothetical protein
MVEHFAAGCRVEFGGVDRGLAGGAGLQRWLGHMRLTFR